MLSDQPPDVAVVGSGPNGLAAAVVMARAGLRVDVYEAAATIGGGARTMPLFDSGVVHDICSAVHPMAAASRFFREFGLAERGVELPQPEAAYAHPLDHGAGVAYRSLERTCERLGADGERWRAFMEPLLDHSTAVVDLMLSDQRRLPADVITPLLLAARVLQQTAPLVSRMFTGPAAPALLAGVAAHAIGPLPSLPGGAVAALLGHLAHGTGWPVPRGGSGRIAEAMAADISAHGGHIHTSSPVEDLRQLARAKAVLLDVSPAVFAKIARPVLPRRYLDRLLAFRYGPGACKVDFLVSSPIPWADPEVGKAGTVHLGGEYREVFAAEKAVAHGDRPDRPFVLLADPTVADPGRAADGKRPVWAYCHVPNGDPSDAADAVQARIEQFAPGFSDTVLARRSMTAPELEAYNANYAGGDIAAGAVDLRQVLFRPTPRVNPYRTPLSGVYLCSASTPPGPGVHGMCGYFAARAALRREFGIRKLPSLTPR